MVNYTWLENLGQSELGFLSKLLPNLKRTGQNWSRICKKVINEYTHISNPTRGGERKLTPVIDFDKKRTVDDVIDIITHIVYFTDKNFRILQIVL